MSTYNLNSVNTSLDFYQEEKYIYGSSRLGMLKDSVNVLGSAYGSTDSTNVIHTLGNKRYELSNHLGNVLTVISDKPIPHNNGGTVDYWQADIKSAYDYSPFGVMLTGRTFEGRETVCHDSTVQATQNALEEGFGTWGSWTAMADGLVTYVADEMQVSNPSSSKKNIGTSKTFTTGEGLHSVSFVVIGNMCSNIVIWPPSSTPIPINVSVKDNLGNVVASGNYTAAGSYNLSFTPASVGLTYRIEFYMANASAFCFFRVDDVLVSYEDESVVTVCREVDGFYRYQFNGMEVDNEVKGKGNSYTTEFRQYDPRLGRWLSLDPAMIKYPSWSPYSFSFNNPILWNDPKGDDPDGEPLTDEEAKAIDDKFGDPVEVMPSPENRVKYGLDKLNDQFEINITKIPSDYTGPNYDNGYRPGGRPMTYKEPWQMSESNSWNDGVEGFKNTRLPNDDEIAPSPVKFLNEKWSKIFCFWCPDDKRVEVTADGIEQGTKKQTVYNTPKHDSIIMKITTLYDTRKGVTIKIKSTMDAELYKDGKRTENNNIPLP